MGRGLRGAACAGGLAISVMLVAASLQPPPSLANEPAAHPNSLAASTDTPLATATPNLGEAAERAESAAQEVEVRRGARITRVQRLQTTTFADGRQAAASHVIVGFHGRIGQVEQQTAHGDVTRSVARSPRVLARLGPDTDVVEVPSAGATDLDQVVQAYRADPRVRYAEPDFVVRAAETPNDPLYGQQWGLQRVQASEAWDVTHGASTRTIAVLDCGIYDETSTYGAPDGGFGHPDLRGKVVARRDFTGSSSGTDDLCDHGTHVAGIAAATTANGLGIAGLGYSTRLLNGKVLDDTGSGLTSWVAQGMYWAADNGASVINLSLSGSGACTAVVQDAINYAWARNVVVLAAAGNTGTSDLRSPASCANVLAVGATDPGDARATFSTYGTWVDVAAPGVDIVSLNNVGEYAPKSGTSMAAPYASGLAALVWTTTWGTSAQAVVDRIRASADAVGGAGVATESGRINAARAVGGVPLTPTPTAVIPVPTPTPTPTPGSGGAPPFSLRRIALPANDIVFDPISRKIFASIPSSAGPTGNSVTSIDPFAVTVDTPVWVGSEPRKLAISDDGSALYVALEGAAAVRRFDPRTRTPGLQFWLGNDSSFGPMAVHDME